MSDDDTTYNTKKLDNFLKAMKRKGAVVQVGILGSKDARKGGGSNATIGAAHEFGTSKIPQRSFLRMPITDYLPKEVQKAKLFSENNLNEIIKDKSFDQTLEQIATMAVAVVEEAFNTSGYGTWQKLSDNYAAERIRKHQGTQILVIPESHQLRDSITYRITKQ